MNGNDEILITWKKTDNASELYNIGLEALLNYKKILFDLKEVSYFDNLKLGTLVSLLSIAKKKNKKIKIINLPEQANNLLKVAKLEGKI